MNRVYRNSVVGGLFACLLTMPASLSAVSGCTNGHLQGVYNSEVANASFQSVLQALHTTSPATTPPVTAGLGNNTNSLSGSMPGLGRYYFDGSGNIIGVTPAKGSVAAFNVAVGKYTVNADCSAKITLTSGAAYDIVLATGGKQALYVRTDAAGGGNVGILRRASSCVNLNYPGSFAFEIGGGTMQTDASGVSGFSPYSVVGSIIINGAGGFNMTETLFTASGTQRSTSTGTYSVGTDCSLTFKFSTAAGANSTGFTAPASLRALMVDATTGLLSLQPDAKNTLTGTLIAQ